MVKVLLCGEVHGEWSTLHTRVLKLNASAHGPFDVLLCTGEAKRLPDLSWPLPVYVLESTALNQPSTNANLHFISTNSVLQLNGLHVAFFVHQDDAFVASLKDKNIDILLSQEYPAAFELLLPQEQVPEALVNVGSEIVKDVVQAAVPRYHVVGSPSVFYQRLPYVTTAPRRRVSRLIGLGQVGDAKNKWLHALNLEVFDENAPVDIPAATTQSPYDVVQEPLAKKKKVDALSADKIQQLTEKSNAAMQFRYDAAIASQGQGAHEQIKRPLVANRSECWFCLATPTVETHLIISIGNEAYLAIPKGPIVPDHVLIIPIHHVSGIKHLSQAALDEIKQFKSALQKFFESQGKSFIIIDRNVPTMGAAHAHLQIIPMPVDALAHVHHIFHEEGKRYNVDFEELAPETPQPNHQEYFMVEFPDDNGGFVRLYHQVRGKHYMQFGRHVAVNLLDMPQREDWKYCVVPKDEETKMTESFKKAFAPFDFTLNLED
ncbi:hypothetical protein THRCLA_09768 [Thraustotheca clavata]|uniref:HIT domain-containing protein n=1 Tax=Thraustotheca clavata TaxID=74557 RepID=A0A1V9YUN7_9STRA|nr:hypothetical protein THRCLA_09768 [Thraustotheca clavata]